VISGLTLLLLLASAGAAHAQSRELYVSAGPTVVDAGSSVASGAGFSPIPALTVLFNVERTHLSSQTRQDGNVESKFRGGTLLLGTAELRYTPFGRARFGPFALVGLGAGVSRPNVNQAFPEPVSHGVRAMFVGGGVQAPLGERVAIFADMRMLVGAEDTEIVAAVPIRAGLAWRF
jgi:hypothetical protein